MKTAHLFNIIFCILFPVILIAQNKNEMNNKLAVALIKNPYTGDRASPETQDGPDILAKSGLIENLTKMGVEVISKPTLKLSSEEEREYGQWNRFGLASGHLKDQIAASIREGMFPVALQANCNSILGMLAGLQHSGGRRPLKVGLIFIDAHGDFNTPETTLSGMLGGMPVAIAAGHCLTRMRQQAGLVPALPEKYIVLAAVRDTDPLEQERIDNSLIEMISVDDIRTLSDNLHRQMQRLSRLTDLIYIHIDMDVLDPKEVMGHPLTVPDGPTSKELAAALELMFQNEKAAALGIASYPFRADPDKISMQAAYNLVEGAVKGVLARK